MRHEANAVVGCQMLLVANSFHEVHRKSLTIVHTEVILFVIICDLDN
jgi:hypothetical protein